MKKLVVFLGLYWVAAMYAPVQTIEMTMVDGGQGMALAPFIFVDCEQSRQDTIAHELVHIRQQREMYIFPFFIEYFIELYENGYRQNKFEAEAYDETQYLNAHNIWW